MKKFVLVLLGACLLLLATLLVLAPWVINRPIVKVRIESELSRALGGPVSYEHANLSIFPHPHVEIDHPRLELPSTLSGTMTSIEMYAELRPLLMGTIRLTSVRLDHPEFTLTLSITPEHPTDAMTFKIPALSLFIHQGRLTVMENQRRLFAFTDLDVQFDALPPSTRSGQSGTAPAESFHITGSARGAIADVAALPGPVNFTIAHFDARPQALSFSDARVQLLDTPFTASGTLDDYLTTISSADLTLQGTFGPEAVRWIRTLTVLPPEMTLHPPVTLTQGHFVWNSNGAVSLEGAASGQNGLLISFNVLKTPDTITVKSLDIRDAESQATLALTLMKKKLDLSFAGHLSQTTLNNLFEQERFRFGSIRGDLNARVVLNRPLDSTVRGTLEGAQLVPPFTLNAPVIINRVALKAAGRTVTVKPLVVSVGGKSHIITGSVTASAAGWGINLKTDGLEWEPLQALFAPATKPESTKPAPPGVPSEIPQQPAAPVQVTLKLDAAYFTAGGWTARPARAEITFTPKATNIRLDEAGVCGVQLSGTVSVQPANLVLNLKTSAHRRPLASTFTCLAGRDLHITGTYDLSGTFTSRGETSAWLDNLRGTASFGADVGITYQKTTTHHQIKGNATLMADHWEFDLKSDGLEWEPLQALFAEDQEKAARPALPKPVTLRLDTDSFSAGGWTAKPARAEIAFNSDTTRMRIDEAIVCGIHLSGTANIQPADLELNFRTTASRLPLAPTLNCLAGRELRITGTYDLSGAFTSTGEESQWLDHLRGSVSFTARNGRIYHDLTSVKILQYLNTTDLMKGKFPDPETEGIPYTSATTRGTLLNNVFTFDKSILVSPIADITGRGSIRLSDRTIDSTYLVAPFPSADAVVKNIPLLKTLLGGSLVTIPVRVRGPFKDPTVTPLPPGQVADDIANMMDQILTLPFKIMSPFIP